MNDEQLDILLEEATDIKILIALAERMDKNESCSLYYKVRSCHCRN